MEQSNPQEDKEDGAKKIVRNALIKYLEYKRIMESGSQYTVYVQGKRPQTVAEIQAKTELNEALKILGIDILK